VSNACASQCQNCVKGDNVNDCTASSDEHELLVASTKLCAENRRISASVACCE
jgi:hypothetical protein